MTDFKDGDRVLLADDRVFVVDSRATHPGARVRVSPEEQGREYPEYAWLPPERLKPAPPKPLKVGDQLTEASAEPPNRTVVLDVDGDAWQLRYGRWVPAMGDVENRDSIADLARAFGPLTILNLPG